MKVLLGAEPKHQKANWDADCGYDEKVEPRLGGEDSIVSTCVATTINVRDIATRDGAKNIAN